MKKFWVVSSVIIVTIIFIYALNTLSKNNTCTWVRIFDCQKNNVQTSIWEDKYNELKTTSDLFLKYCEPNIIENENNYLFNYSDCDLKVSINKEKAWVESVEINNNNLSREQINSNF